MSVKHPWVILFDIDGTLLTVDRNFNRRLLRNILDELKINYPDMEKDSFSGRTDYDIVTSFLVNHEYDEVLYRAFKEQYLDRLQKEITEKHVLCHNYVDESIEFFSKSKCIIGLLTGNYPDAAMAKLKTAEIHHDFAFGAFGEFHKDRNMLAQLALTSINEMLNIKPETSRFVIIGDTPRDIECAKSAGMKCVAVATGRFNSEELSDYNPDLIIDDLSNPEKWFYELTGERI